MRVRLKPGLVIITAEEAEELDELSTWAFPEEGHVFLMGAQANGQTIVFRDLGIQSEACREPINIVSTSTGPAVQLISNLANTQFELTGKTYASVEGFWQGIKFPDEATRAKIALLHGQDAKQAGESAADTDTIEFNGLSVRTGTYEHWALMYMACMAKFSQHDGARRALLSTGSRPLVHRVRRDSRTIPGVIMADIWMKVRARLAKGEDGSQENDDEDS